MGKFNVALVTMPQTVTAMPSIGLTQLSGILNDKFKEKVDSKVIYANLDFIEFVGFDNYKSIETHGLTEWIFRRYAFPDVLDNTEHFKKFVFADGETATANKAFGIALEIRDKVDDFLEDLILRHDLASCDLVGFTLMMSQNIASIALAKKIKEKNPACIIVVGGPNCDYPMGKTLVNKEETIDYAFAGPSLKSFPDFVDCILKGNIEDTHKINGIFTKKNNLKGMEGKNEFSEELYGIEKIGDFFDINETPELDYGGFLDRYEKFRQGTNFPYKPVLFFETSRGCWKRDKLPCTFCGLNDPAAHYVSMKSNIAIEYINKLVKKYYDRCFAFSCVDSIVAKNYLAEVIPFLEIPSDVVLLYETRSNLTKDEMTACAQFGVKMLQPGIEALNTELLKLMQKGVSVFTNLKFLKNCVEVGIYPVWNLLYGAPGEEGEANIKKLLSDLPMLRHLPPPATFTPIGMQRFSPYFENEEKYRLELKVAPSYSFIYPYEEADIVNLAYNFIDINAESTYLKDYKFYVQMINRDILEWLSSYRDDTDFPQLYFSDELTIYDSRYDIKAANMHSISPLQREILLFLDNPYSIDNLKEKFSHIPENELEKAFKKLKRKNLLFNEDEVYMSLVCQKSMLDKKGYNKLVDFISLSTSQEF